MEKMKFMKFSYVLAHFTKVSKLLPYILNKQNSRDFILSPSLLSFEKRVSRDELSSSPASSRNFSSN